MSIASAPDSGLARWLRTAAPALGPAQIGVRIVAPPVNADNGFAVTVENGVAGSTTFDLAVKSAGGLADWRSKPADVSLMLNSPDSAALARQFGMGAVAIENDPGSQVTIKGSGVPAEGLDTSVEADVAGLATRLTGKLKVGEDLTPSFAGKARLKSAEHRSAHRDGRARYSGRSGGNGGRHRRPGGGVERRHDAGMV